MCRHYSLGRRTSYITKRFKAHIKDPFQGDFWEPNWHIRTLDQGLVVRVDPKTGERVASAMQWGLVPPGAKDLRAGANMVNFRAETVLEKNVWKGPFQKRRCLVPADGWYEFKEGNDRKSRKQPWRLQLPGRPAPLFSFAGIWSGWQKPDGAWLHSYAIATNEPAPSIASIHDRMPIPLADEAAEAKWLDPDAAVDDLLALLQTYTGDLIAFPAHDDVRQPKGKGPSHLEYPLDYQGDPKPPRQL